MGRWSCKLGQHYRNGQRILLRHGQRCGKLKKCPFSFHVLIKYCRMSSATALHLVTTTKAPPPTLTRRLTVPTTLSPSLTRTLFLLLSRPPVTINSTAQTVSRVNLLVNPRHPPHLHQRHLLRPTPYLVSLALVLTVSLVVLMLPTPALLPADQVLLARPTPRRALAALQVPVQEVPLSVKVLLPLPTRVHAWLLAALSRLSPSLLPL